MDMSDNFVSGNPNMSDTDLNHMPRGFGIGMAICDDPPNMSWIRHNLFQDITAQAVNVTGAASLAVTGKAPDSCVPSIPVPQLVRQTNKAETHCQVAEHGSPASVLVEFPVDASPSLQASLTAAWRAARDAEPKYTPPKSTDVFVEGVGWEVHCSGKWKKSSRELVFRLDDSDDDSDDEINQPVEGYWSPEEPLYDQTTSGHQGHQQQDQQLQDDYDYEYGFYDPGPANLEEAIREYEERYAPSRASK